MKQANSKTAVITGASSGIGYSLTKKALENGYNVVMADIRDDGYQMLSSDDNRDRLMFHATDVTNSRHFASLSDVVFDNFDKIDLLINNAGIGTPLDLTRPMWEIPLADWRLTFDVNVHGIINGLHTFVPIMIQQGNGYIVNTASLAGFVPNKVQVSYLSSKHAVVALTESLSLQLENMGINIGVSLLVPGPVQTSIVLHAKEMVDQINDFSQHEIQKLDRFHEGLKNSMSPDLVADQVFQAINKNQFYIFTHDWIGNLIEKRYSSIVEGKPKLPF